MPAEDPSDRPDRFEGTDDTGVVTVVVDRLGVVTDVTVATTWRDEVPSGELGPALCAAAGEALTRRLADEFEHLEPPAFEAVPRDDAKNGGGDPAGAVATNLQAEVADLLVAFDRELVAYQRELREVAEAATTARSRKGAVEVTVGHGRVIAVAVEPSWARKATRADIRAEALDAFTAAAEQMSTAGPGTVSPPPAIARLARLAADPVALSRELGLR